jgi:hypothetical protein
MTQERKSLLSNRETGGGKGNFKCEQFNTIARKEQFTELLLLNIFDKKTHD